jgi:hypothetical protein
MIDSHSNRSEVGSSCGFIYVSFMARDVEHFFMCFFWPFILTPLKKLCSVYLPSQISRKRCASRKPPGYQTDIAKIELLHDIL